VLLARLRAAAWSSVEGARKGCCGGSPRSGRARANKETEGDGRRMAGHCGKDMGLGLGLSTTVANSCFDFV
jgi:hypothetical protein